MTAALMPIVLPVALSAVSALLVWALHKLAAFLGAKAAAEKAGSLQARVVSALQALANCAADSIRIAVQKLGPEAAAALKGGTLTAAQWKALRDEALAIAKAQAVAMFPTLLAAAGLEGASLDTVLGQLLDATMAKHVVP